MRREGGHGPEEACCNRRPQVVGKGDAEPERKGSPGEVGCESDPAPSERVELLPPSQGEHNYEWSDFVEEKADPGKPARKAPRKIETATRR